MIVEIDFEVFNDETSFRVLDRLIGIFTQRHHWDIGNPKRIQESKWLINEDKSRLGASVNELIEKTFVNSGYITTKIRRCELLIKISVHPEPTKNVFLPDIAFDYLNSPVFIIVENFASDKAFLEAIIFAFKYFDLQTAINKGWIMIEGVGGIGEIPKKIGDYFRQPRQYPPKLYIVVDSDRQFPGDNHNAQPVLDKCKEKGIPDDKITILYKRAIENYLPLEILAEVPQELQPVYEAYKSLHNPDQWDYYDMKRGFEIRRKNDSAVYDRIPDKQREFFGDLKKDNPKLFEDLKGGFSVRGFDLYQLFTEQKDNITRTMLKERCKHHKKHGGDPDELERLLEGIASLL